MTRARRPSNERLRAGPAPVACDAMVTMEGIPPCVVARSARPRGESAELAVGDQGGGQLEAGARSCGAEALELRGHIARRILPVSAHSLTPAKSRAALAGARFFFLDGGTGGGGVAAIDAAGSQPLVQVRHAIPNRSADAIPRWARGSAADMPSTPVRSEKCDRNTEPFSGGTLIYKRHG